MSPRLSLVLTTIVFILSSGGAAYAGTPPIDTCYTNPDPTVCGLTANPFSSIMGIFDVIIPGFGTLLLWGPIVFAFWIKTQKAEIAGIVGIIISATVTGLNPQAINMGIVLLAISAGLSLVGIFQRVKLAQ
jgi:hypothetical protein